MTEAEAIADLERQIEESGTSLDDRSGSAEIAALTLVAEAYEMAAASLEDRGSDGWAENVMAEYASVNAEAIRSLTPSDALAAREARDKRVRQEALREAAKCADEHTHVMHPREVAKSILALIEGDQTDECGQTDFGTRDSGGYAWRRQI